MLEQPCLPTVLTQASSSVNKMNFVVINVCRVCLKVDEGKSLKDDKDLCEKFVATTNIEISDDDSMPSLICDQCSRRLRIAYEFVQQARTSEKSLKIFLTKVANDFEQVTKTGLTSSSSSAQEENNDVLAMYIEDTTADDDKIELIAEKVNQKQPLAKQSDTNAPIQKTYDLPLTTTTSSPFIEKDTSNEHELSLINLNKTVGGEDNYVLSLVSDKEEAQVSPSSEVGESQIVVEMLDLPDEDVVCDTELAEAEDRVKSQDMQFKHFDELIDDAEYLEDTSMEEHLVETEMSTENQRNNSTIITGIYTPNSNEVVVLHRTPTSSSEKQKSGKPLKSHKSTKKVARCAGEERDDRIVCKTCGKDFSTRTNLRRHIVQHEQKKPFACKYCEKSFTQNGSLKQHIYTHTGEKPFVCEICERGFTQSKSLVFHMRRHTGAKPFPCQYCERKFRQKDALKKHVYNSHLIHSQNEEKHFCTLCNELIASKEALQLHMNKHANNHEMLPSKSIPSTASSNLLDLEAKTHIIQVEATSTAQPNRAKRFQCRQCLKCFALKNSLMRHLEVHGTLKCTVCDANFATFKILEEHIKNEHTEESLEEELVFMCVGCETLLPTESLLEWHMKDCIGAKLQHVDTDEGY